MTWKTLSKQIKIYKNLPVITRRKFQSSQRIPYCRQSYLWLNLTFKEPWLPTRWQESIFVSTIFTSTLSKILQLSPSLFSKTKLRIPAIYLVLSFNINNVIVVRVKLYLFETFSKFKHSFSSTCFKIPIKPVNWLAQQINWLVSIWGQHYHLIG